MEEKNGKTDARDIVLGRALEDSVLPYARLMRLMQQRAYFLHTKRLLDKALKREQV